MTLRTFPSLQDASGARLERFFSAKAELPPEDVDHGETLPTSIEEPDDALTSPPDLVICSFLLH